MALPRILAKIVKQLQEHGRLTAEQVEAITSAPEDMSGDALEKLLLSEFKVSEFQLLLAKARAFDLKPFNAGNFRVDERTWEKLDREFCATNRVLPIGQVGECFVIAVGDPFNLSVAQKVQDMTRRRVVTLLSTPRDLTALLVQKTEGKVESEGFGDVMQSLEGDFGIEDEEFSEEDLEEESSPIVQLASRIIEDAYFSGGSDIHIDPGEKSCRVRVRIDGVLTEKLSLPPKAAGSLLARLKVMANLDIAEKRLPQDGRIVFKQFTKKGLDIDLRVATGPLNHGEGVVMRILDKQKSTLPLPALGFSPENLELYRELIQRPYGMVLHCGPTGSGKSMTLYSALNEINTPDVCVRTAEDPIEYTLPGLCQMQMNKKIGLTFATALRAFLRQDPDIILVGEIRDKETAQIAVEAALTGHMLFSTLHTNDAPSTIARLTEMEIEPFMISASLVCVCAQRLMRRVCKTCRQKYQPEGNEQDIIRRAIQYDGPVYRANPSGCPACGGNGMKGRVGIHELMATSEDLVKGINAGLEAARLKRIAMRTGMKTLHQDSMYKVRDGISTMEESLANVPPDMEDLEEIRRDFALEEARQRKEKAQKMAEAEA